MYCRVYKVILASIVLVLSFQLVVFAGDVKADFYVSPAGNNSWSGRLAAPNAERSDGPFATIGRVRDAVRQLKKSSTAGDITVLIRGGTYYLKETVVFGLEDSGNKNQSIKYAAYPGEEPVFSSGVRITGWKKLKKYPVALPAKARGRVWVADMPKKPGQFFTLYDGDKRLPRARSEAFAPTKRYNFRNEGVPFEPDYVWPPRDTLHFPKGALKNWSNLEDVEIVIRPHNVWLLNILPLASVDENSFMARTKIEGTYALGRLSGGHKNLRSSCWVENVLVFLDEPGEWVLNTREGKLYLWPEAGQPGNILAPALRELVKVQGDIDEEGPIDKPVRNLVFKGLTFTQADRDLWSNNDKGIIHDWEMFDKDNALVRFRGAENCAVEECHFVNSGGTGVRLDLHCQYNRISGNYLHNLGGTGIFLCGYGPGTKDVNKHNEVLNNCIHDCGEIYRHSQAILVWQSGENRIANNLIYNMPYDAIGLVGVRPHFFDEPFKSKWRENSRTIRWNEIGSAKKWEHIIPFLHTKANVVEYNELHHVMQLLDDGNAIYTSATGPFNIVRCNYLHHISRPVAVLRTDGWQKDTLIAENIVYKCSGGIHRKNYNHIENNIFVDVPEKGEYIGFRSFPAEELTTIGSRIQRNIFYHCGKSPNFYHVKKHRPGRQPTMPGHCQADYNLFYCAGEPNAASEFLNKIRADGIEEHSICADPLFVDLENGDFRLRPASPALKLGFKQIDVARIGLTEDFPERFRQGM